MRPRALDLFCCGGGAAYGLHLAGYDVTGVDLAPQPRFPFTFRQADALTFPLDGYDLIWASPPCQGYTAARHLRGNDHPMLIGPVRERLAASGIPYVIENVEGAPLTDPVTLCGTMFGLKTYRHRLFEASFPLDQPAHQPHTGRLTSDIGRPPLPGDYITAVGHFSGADYGRAALGIWWMTVNELRESIPPAYSAMIGLAAAAKFGYELPPLSVTLAADRRARDNALAAERMRRYRARRRGRKGAAVAPRKPGPQPKMISHYAAELARARTELAALKAAAGGEP